MIKPDTKSQILECEKTLLEAFTKKDLIALEELLHENCLFILPNATTATKPMVLENYRKGNTVMAWLTINDPIISFIDNTAVISVNQHLKGSHFGKPIDADFRYLRVWKLVINKWKVIAVSGIQIPG